MYVRCQAGVRDKLKIIAAGKVLTGFSLVRTLVGTCRPAATAYVDFPIKQIFPRVADVRELRVGRQMALIFAIQPGE